MENHDATRTVASFSSSGVRTSSDGRFLPGATIAGRYRIIALLGRGGMGEVYRADDLTLGQPVALKFLPPSVANHPATLERFRNEVRIARKVSHPNVCRVYDLGEVDGHVFLSMEYVDGEDLGSLVRRIGKLPHDKALEVARKLCAGLAAAHEKGVLHRDLKPANVMLDGRGQVLLTDFGLAGIADQIQGGEIRNGTPAYMAPEQLAGKEVTFKSDIYSLGLVLYEILTGKRAFEAESLDELQRLRSSSTLTNPSTLVKDLDPRVERVIMRCLEADPQKRPASALSVAAALPGGDPLGEALAAGETPSPEMVAAAGEGAALSPMIAVAMLVAILIGLFAQAVLSRKLSALERMHLEYPPEVLRQKARDITQKLGYTERPADDAYSIGWDTEYAGFIESHGNPNWDAILQTRPTLLRFTYRQSDYPMIAGEFHDDKLTPGIVTHYESDPDPAPVMSGMISLTLDSDGRLMRFRAVPPQIDPSPAKPMDWSALFDAAQLNMKHFERADPQWTFLATSDERAAWTGEWPGTKYPLRVEAAAFHGRPVGFTLIGPWAAPSRMPPRETPLSDHMGTLVMIGLGMLVIVSTVFFGWRNFKSGRSDRRGALRLAQFIFAIHLLLWVLRGHFAPSIFTIGLFFVALATSAFYGMAIWMLYIALDPYVRRYWPQALISWTGVLQGRYTDPIVGRDVLFGVSLGVVWILLDRTTDVIAQARGIMPNVGNTIFLLGTRAMLGTVVGEISIAILAALAFFLTFFVMRLLLRNQWLAAAGFVLIWTSTVYFRVSATTATVQGIESIIIYSIAAVMVVRFGLLSLVVGVAIIDLLTGLQIPNPSQWYFADTLAVVVGMAALTIWAFRVSLGGRRVLGDDLL
jgi:serine/threonine-protein kinase